MPIEPTPIDPVPTPVPTQDDPSNFPARGDAMMEWFETGVPGIDQAAQDTYDNALEVFNAATSIAAAALVASDAAGFVATSTSTLTVNAGTKTIHFDAARPKLAVAAYQVAIVLASDNSVKMIGNVATVTDSDDITVTVVSSGVSGSGGPFSGPWLIIAGAFLGSGATAAEMWAMLSDGVAISPASLKAAKVWVPLTDAATVTPNGANGRNFTWTVGGSRLLAAITNCTVNDIYRLWLTKASGGALAWASCYTRVGGLPVLPTTIGHEAHLEIRVLAVDGSNVCTDAFCTYASNPVNA